MKNYLFAFSFGLITLSLSGQEQSEAGFSKGDIFASGTIAFSTSSQGELKSTSYAFLPSVGYFLSDHIVGEFALLIGSSTFEENDFNFERNVNDFGVALGATYFFTPSKRFSFTLGTAFSYLNTKNEEVNLAGIQEFTVNTFEIGLAPGINYFVSQRFAIRTFIGVISYSYSKADSPGAEARNTFNINLDLSDVNFGILYRF